ncbi:RloB family protein [Kutzneria sp. NPDC051319]|uniref:RloB family protein n=1 Tax=Kutzneria sp. NPDC051319 TaxID=3155047 RepID=UPI00343838A6
MRRDNTGRHRVESRTRRHILIVCGGTRTELDYFEGLTRARGNPAVQFTILGKGIAPDQLVRHAKRVPGDHDEIWCVVDTDEFDIAKAARLADELGVRLVVSNPCFELWLLLHFVGSPRGVRELSAAAAQVDQTRARLRQVTGRLRPVRRGRRGRGRAGRAARSEWAGPRAESVHRGVESSSTGPPGLKHARGRIPLGTCLPPPRPVVSPCSPSVAPVMRSTPRRWPAG